MLPPTVLERFFSNTRHCPVIKSSYKDVIANVWDSSYIRKTQSKIMFAGFTHPLALGFSLFLFDFLHSLVANFVYLTLLRNQLHRQGSFLRLHVMFMSCSPTPFLTFWRISSGVYLEVIVAAYQMTHTGILNKCMDFSGFEHCWRHLG